MNPEQAIQDAWVARAKREIASKRAAGLQAREITFPVWAPEEAVQALLAIGWTAPACGCGPKAVSDDKVFYEAVMADLQALDEAGSTIEQALRDIADGGEWPETPS